MTKEDIIRMAREAGMPMAWISDSGVLNWVDLLAFANRVAKHEREKCAKLCRRPWQGLTDDQLDEIAVIARRGNLHDLRIAIEAAHNIKENT